MSVLSVQSVSYSYKTKYQTVQAVKDVSCDLSAGTFYALVGKSGSGKTTLLSLLAGLDTPQSGDIIVGGQSLREIDVDIYRRKQASVIYQSYNLFPLMTVCENVMYPLKLLSQMSLREIWIQKTAHKLFSCFPDWHMKRIAV